VRPVEPRFARTGTTGPFGMDEITGGSGGLVPRKESQCAAGRPRSGGSLPAAASSRRNSVRWRPRAPAAGSWTGPGPDRGRATALAFSAPEARIQTSRAAWIEPNVSEIRTGGGLGEPRTATTGRLSYTAGISGNSEAT